MNVYDILWIRSYLLPVNRTKGFDGNWTPLYVENLQPTQIQKSENVNREVQQSGELTRPYPRTRSKGVVKVNNHNSSEVSTD